MYKGYVKKYKPLPFLFHTLGTVNTEYHEEKSRERKRKEKQVNNKLKKIGKHKLTNIYGRVRKSKI